MKVFCLAGILQQKPISLNYCWQEQNANAAHAHNELDRIQKKKKSALNVAQWLVNCPPTSSNHSYYLRTSADTSCLRFWLIPCTILVWKNNCWEQEKKMEIYKMPITHFPSSSSLTPCLLLPASLPLIDQWQNLGDMCFIKCLTAFLFLLAKQGIWEGQSYHHTSLSVVLHISPATEKACFPVKLWKTVSEKH